MTRALLQIGQVWWGKIPFGEVVDAKTRPVVVLGWRGFNVPNGDPHILVVPSSTFGGDPSKARESDIRLADWTLAGLAADSFIQCGRVWSLAPAAIDFDSPLTGSVSSRDMLAIMTEVGSFFGATGYVAIP